MKKRWNRIAVLTLAGAGCALCLGATGRGRALLREGVKGINIFAVRMQEQGLATVILWIRDHLLRRIEGVSPADTSQIMPGLFVGGQQYPHGLARMAARNISASVNLRDEADDTARGVALERHLWLRTVDDTPPTLAQLAQAADFIGQSLANGRGVYIHCAAGVGRAPTTAAAYLVSAGQTPEQAWATIRQARPFIRPKDGQIAQINAFYKHLNTSST